MDKGKLSTSANLLRVSSLGITFVLCTFAGVLLGLLGRKYFHLGDWAVIVGFLFGVLTSYVILFEDVRKLNKGMGNPPTPKGQ